MNIGSFADPADSADSFLALLVRHRRDAPTLDLPVACIDIDARFHFDTLSLPG